MGLSLATSIDDDSSWVGKNDLVPPPPEPNPLTPEPMGGSFSPNANAIATATKIYRYFADAEGVFILYSAADPTTASSEAGNGLFGTVLVQPPHAEYYRSQVLRTDLIDATYHSMNLPPNIVLRRQPQQPGESADAPPVWLLTTYKTRLRDFVLKNVEVDVIGEAEDIQRLTGALPQVMQAKTFLRRDLETGESIKLDHGPKEEIRELQEKGEVIPEGNLYARSTRASADRLFNRLQGESRAAHRMAGPGDALSRGEGLAGGPNRRR